MNSLPGSTQNIEFSTHNFSNSIIQIMDDNETGNWLFWVAATHKGIATNEIYMSSEIEYISSENTGL